MRLFRRCATALLLGLGAVAAVHAEPDRTPLQIDLALKGAPANVAAGSLPGSNERNIRLRVEDGRGAEAGAVIGQGVNDGVVVFPILARNDVAKYVDEVAHNVLNSWGLRLGDGSDGSLVLRFTKLNVAHNNRAVGATYVGNATIQYALTNRLGRILASGSFSGNVDHYGKGRSAEDCNEALSEAVTNALLRLLNDANFRKVWSTSPAITNAAPPAPAKRTRAAVPAPSGGKSLEARLHELDALYKDGTINKDEYDKRRAEILKEI